MSLDERFTEETRQFVATVGPQIGFLVNAELSTSRAMINQAADMFNSQVKFEKIKLNEFSVKSRNEDYDIAVTAHIPENVAPNAPIVVFFHGGGWRMFSRKSHQMSVSHLATESNCVWLSVEYRLSPEFKHPIAIEDCCSVVKWVDENKVAMLNSAPNAKIGVCGDSTGGHLAAWVSYELKSILAFQILIYPYLDLKLESNSCSLFRNGYIINKEMLQISRKDYLINEEQSTIIEASPLYFNCFENLPKCLIINAELDPLFDDGFKYKHKLDSANVHCEHYVIKGTVHSFFHAYLDFKNAFTDAANHIVEFLKKIQI